MHMKILTLSFRPIRDFIRSARYGQGRLVATGIETPINYFTCAVKRLSFTTQNRERVIQFLFNLILTSYPVTLSLSRVKCE